LRGRATLGIELRSNGQTVDKGQDDLSMTRTHYGRIAVISGAASGIGQASAVRLANEGTRVVVADRANAQQTLNLITASGRIATAIVCNVSDPKSVAALKTEVELNMVSATS
jgi:NADP-dependent 3-hydroxy acid dehydrogenase YdfG